MAYRFAVSAGLVATAGWLVLRARAAPLLLDAAARQIDGRTGR
jgi:hypothetical protein